jgi:hypothetical protein
MMTARAARCRRRASRPEAVASSRAEGPGPNVRPGRMPALASASVGRAKNEPPHAPWIAGPEGRMFRQDAG